MLQLGETQCSSVCTITNNMCVLCGTDRDTDKKTWGGGLKTPLCSEWAHGGIRSVSGPLEQCGGLKRVFFFLYSDSCVPRRRWGWLCRWAESQSKFCDWEFFMFLISSSSCVMRTSLWLRSSLSRRISSCCLWNFISSCGQKHTHTYIGIYQESHLYYRPVSR